MTRKEKPKGQKTTRYTIWAIVLVIVSSGAISAVLGFVYRAEPASQNLNNETNQRSAVADYQTLVKQYLKAYRNKINQLSFTDRTTEELISAFKEKKKAVEDLGAKLLTLSVPGDLKDLHFGLVTAYDLVDRASQKMIEAENYQAGLNGASLDLDKSAQARQEAGELETSANNKINQLLSQYSWLK